MADWEDVRQIALALPDAEEGTSYGDRDWKIRGKSFVWERPLRRGDLEHLGDDAPAGDVLGVRVADLDAKDALLAEEPDCCFTTPHFDGYPSVLVSLATVPTDLLRELIAEAWLARAPKRLAAAYQAARQPE